MSGSSLDDSGKDEPRQELQLDGTAAGTEAAGKTAAEVKNADTSFTSGLNDAVTKADRPNAVKATSKSWFEIPAPLKRIFDKFPLVTYSENHLPIRSFVKEGRNILCIYSTTEAAALGRPSFNPTCLKWQTYLKICGIPFATVLSNNHASPSGSLPFLFVANNGVAANVEVNQSVTTIPHNRLKRWVDEGLKLRRQHITDGVRYEVYTSLIEGPIRKAWLYQLYLHPRNQAVVHRLYIRPCTSNPLVQFTIGSQLRAAAESEIVKAFIQSGSRQSIDEIQIMRGAEEAFEALSTLLGDSRWFFDQATVDKDREGAPTLFDAAVFAYTHLILGDTQGEAGTIIDWTANPLGTGLRGHENLVSHRNRLMEMYF